MNKNKFLRLKANREAEIQRQQQQVAQYKNQKVA